MKILYLNHVSWDWIFQRPQIFALYLQHDFFCSVVNKYYLLSKNKAKNIRPKNEIRVPQLPKENSFKIVKLINSLIYRFIIKKNVKKYDVIWICHPSLYKYIPESYKGMIIYDCMDNHVAMSVGDKVEIQYYEDLLMNKASTIFVSSEKLLDIHKKYSSKITLVRNGFVSSYATQGIKTVKYKEQYKIGYFGTISSWFDYNLLNVCAKANTNVKFFIIGPIDSAMEFPMLSPNIEFLGIVEHSELSKTIMDYDALIMPFKLNDIILSVDPVKLYEYLSFGKCIISVKYPEIERFEPFVYFYKNGEDLIKIIGELSHNGFKPKYNETQRQEFLLQNTWDCRYKIIKLVLNEISQIK